jgi:cytoskeleton protein RodZ
MSDATRGFFAVEPTPLLAGEDAPSVGIQLRRAREQRKLTLTQVSRELRLKEEILRAIESGQHSSLPNHSFAVGYVRAYAGYLGIDPRGAAAKFKDEVGTPVTAPATLNVPRPMREGRFPGRFMVSASLVLAALVYGGWYLHVTENADPAASLASSAKGSAPAKGDGKPSSSVVATNSLNPGSNSSKVPEAGKPSAAATPDEPGTKPETTETRADAPRGANSEVGGTTSKNPAPVVPADLVVLKAKALVWLDIREPTGAVIMQKALKAGEEFHLPQGKKLIANIGNPPGLEISVGGRVLKPIGNAGRPMTNVSLDPARLAKLP